METGSAYGRFWNAIPCGLCVTLVDDGFTIVSANSCFYSVFGFTQQEAGPAGFSDLRFIIPPSDFPEVARASQGSPFDAKAIRQGGEPIWIHCACCAHPDVPEQMIWAVHDVASAKDAEQKLQIVEEEQRILMQQTGRVITKYDVATKTLYQPKIAADMFGLPCVCHGVPDSIVKTFVADISRGEYLRFYKSMCEGKPYGSSFIRIRNITGSYAWYAMKYTLTYDAQGNPFRGIISYEDVTDLQEKEIAYKKWQNNMELQREKSIAYYEYDLSLDIFEHVAGEISDDLPDDSRKSFSTVTIYVAEHFVHPDDKEGYLGFFSRNKLLARFYMGQKECQFEHRRIDKDKNAYWALASIQLVSDPYTNDIKASVFIKNINDEKEALLKLRKLSCTDPLTGLLNRKAMSEQVNAILLNSAPSEHHIFAMIDLDNFKRINDNQGHKFGDRVLCDIATEIKNGVRVDDLCARLGGDEFVVLLKNTSLDARLSNKMQNLCSLLSKTYDNGVVTSGSVGIAVYPRDGNTFETLYEKADVALYQAKKHGRNQFLFFEG